MTRVQRIHTWLADRITWVQYPNVRPNQPAARLSFFRHQMPFPIRMALVLFGVFAATISLFMLAALGLIVWAAVTA